MSGGLCKYMDEIGSVCYDKAHINIHSMVLHYIDADGYEDCVFHWPVRYNGSFSAFNIRLS